MCEDVIEALFEINEVARIIIKWGLISRAYIDNMMNMVHMKYIYVDVVNKLPIREDRGEKRYQISKCTIIDYWEYYFHYYCYNK